MMRGEVDFLYEVGPETREFLESRTVRRRLSRSCGTMSTASSSITKRPIFRDPRFGRALNYAVDRARPSLHRHSEVMELSQAGQRGRCIGHTTHQFHSTTYDPGTSSGFARYSAIPRAIREQARRLPPHDYTSSVSFRRISSCGNDWLSWSSGILLRSAWTWHWRRYRSMSSISESRRETSTPS